MLDNWARSLGLRTNPQIFFWSTLLAVVFVIGTILFTEGVNSLFSTMTGFILSTLSWFYILGVTVFLLFLVWIAISRYGGVRLGGKDSRPEYSNWAWFAMLFAAGIGTILMFWAVAEPINHYANPPMAPEGYSSTEEFAQTAGAAQQAITITNYHFALHTWAIFTVPALAFAYFIFKRGLPMRVSSIFYPFLGERIHGPIGKTIDITAILGTLFGLSVSIGLGSAQINAGMANLFPGLPTDPENPVTLLNQLGIIVIITLVAIVSVALGLDKGIKRLSNINILASIGLLLFVFIAGSTLFLAKGTVEQTGDYLANVIPLGFWNDTFSDTGWQDGWTVFYWAWTITWAPFIGIFIARISKGRTIREFVAGVLGLPTLFSVIWFSIFGLAAFDIERANPGVLVGPVVEDGDVPGALFAFLENFPVATEVGTAIAAIAVLIVAIFFITSSDSASLVIDMMCTGDQNVVPPTRQRVYWAVLEGVVALALVGGAGAAALSALAEVITVIGLPFFIMSFFMMAALVKELSRDPDVPGNEPPPKQREPEQETEGELAAAQQDSD